MRALGKIKAVIIGILLHPFLSFSQETFPVNGVKDNRNNVYYVFTNASVFSDYQNFIANASLLIKDGVVIEVGTKVKIPAGAVVYDLKGKYIYPSFIDLYTEYGLPRPAVLDKKDKVAAEKIAKGPLNWNAAIHPEQKAINLFEVDEKQAEEYRGLGFGGVLAHVKDGLARGTSVFSSLADASENEVILLGDAAAHYSFNKGSSKQDYPSSLMGAIALLRQSYLDADWYKNQGKLSREYNASLEAWNANQTLPQIFETKDKLNLLRADKLGDEFGVQFIIKSAGDEYQRIEDTKASKATLIVPVNFPKAYDVEDAFEALEVSLEEMKHWELAPTNLSKLLNNQIEFALTTADLKDKSDFLKNLNLARKAGISSSEIVKALTYTPAKIINFNNKLGSLNPGFIANFIITSDTLFSDKFLIHENWVQGKKHVINEINLVDTRGEYHLNLGEGMLYKLRMSGEITKPAAEIILSDTNKVKVQFSLDGNKLTLAFDLNDKSNKGFIRLSGKINYNSGIWDGKGQMPDGKWINWSCIKNKKSDEKVKKEIQEEKKPDFGKLTYPLMAYGWEKLPSEETVIIKNTTVWTSDEKGVLKNTDVAIHHGKIIAIEKGLTKDLLFPKQKLEVKIIDGTGKHLTPGIIDEHSHIAISKGVNESTQANTAEVRIGDVINSDDINIYRQLAGGVTAVQLLHGSSNPIGGQSALIKLRWGLSPENMKIRQATGFIKFALGENVKQSNWNSRSSSRFPQSRMGVEQVYYDAFYRAKEYQAEWNSFRLLSAKEKVKNHPPRMDLELEAMVEILNKKRFITCHSYIQSEINMLMNVADSMGFKVNTFTHILEGYKVADKMKTHGVGASTFSDWWAYKFEVNDAIPFNASLLHAMEIVTAINSDDAEMGRRLNQEAAKIVKYGGVSEEEALKMITINPAKLLHLDSLMGSIREGKQADLVLWDTNPLSVYSKVEKTFVDGIIYYDVERDKQLRELIQQERARLVQKMILAKKNGESTQKADSKKHHSYHCETIEEEGIYD